MDRRAVPDEEDLAPDLAQENPQKAYHSVAVVAVLAHLQEEASVERHATNGEKMILAEFDTQTRRVAPWRPRSHGVRQQVER